LVEQSVIRRSRLPCSTRRSQKPVSSAANGEIIAASQGYESKPNAENGIEAIKTHAPKAKVEDHSGT
jgi:hypothetical protein